MKKSLCLFIAIVCWSCKHSSETEKYQNKYDNIVNVHNKVKEIVINDVLINSLTKIYAFDKYLIILDYKSHDEQIHLFDKNTFKYVTRTAYKGQGPGEIANIGHIGLNETDRIFYVIDHGKQRIFSYELDSLLLKPSYIPKEKMTLEESLFPADYHYIYDTLCIGSIIEPTGNYGFKQSLAKWDMNTGKITPMKYTHPEIEKKRVTFAVSTEFRQYVECYNYHDLMTINSLDGDFKYNIYGPKWNNETSNDYSYYSDVMFIRDRIFAGYHSGENTFYKSKNGEIRSTLPSKFIIFDINGNYIQTLETEYKITAFCYDKENNRIIMSLDDEIQFAYLGLNEYIKK